MAMHDKAHTIAGKGDFTRSRGTSFRGVRQDVGRVRIHSLFCNRAKPGQHTIFTGRTCFHACTRAPARSLGCSLPPADDDDHYDDDEDDDGDDDDDDDDDDAVRSASA